MIEDIKKVNPNGLLLPIILYADEVSIGMNGKAKCYTSYDDFRLLFKIIIQTRLRKNGYWLH